MARLPYDPFVPERRPRRVASACYWAPVGEFLSTPAESILGRLAEAHSHDVLEAEQIRAWNEELLVLETALAGLGGTLYLEFDVPRLGSRIDAVLVSGSAVVPIEFKCGEQKFSAAAYNQAWDYALDLKNFHLATSMRSFRSEKVSAFVKALLDCETAGASDILREISPRYPIALTRSLTKAKQWIRDHARGSERFGLVASSQAQRLKPHAIDVRVNVDPIHWFLADRGDTRSSYYLDETYDYLASLGVTQV